MGWVIALLMLTRALRHPPRRVCCTPARNTLTSHGCCKWLSTPHVHYWCCMWLWLAARATPEPGAASCSGLPATRTSTLFAASGLGTPHAHLWCCKWLLLAARAHGSGGASGLSTPHAHLWCCKGLLLAARAHRSVAASGSCSSHAPRLLNASTPRDTGCKMRTTRKPIMVAAQWGIAAGNCCCAAEDTEGADVDSVSARPSLIDRPPGAWHSSTMSQVLQVLQVT